MKSEIVNEDLLEWLKNYDGERFHGVLSDPPYALISVAKRFGKKDAAPAQEGSDGRFSRLSAGFMGQKWDSFRDLDHFEDWVAEWAHSMMRVLYPGAVCMFFGGTRTYHRLARGLERGGFEILDCLMWLYGSGFPKSHDISKGIDKAAGAERTEVIGERHRNVKPYDEYHTGDTSRHSATGDFEYKAPVTPEAEQWDGYGTALKPAWEPIILCRTPRGSMTFAELAKTYGTGALNIDESRIEHDGSGVWGNHGQHPEKHKREPGSDGTTMGTGWHRPGSTRNPSGRWPANLLLSHHEDCVKVGEFEVKARVINRWKDGMKPFGDGAGGEYETIHPSRQGEPSADRTYEDEGGTNFAMKPGARRDADLETVERWACVSECPIRALDDQVGNKIHSAGSARKAIRDAKETGMFSLAGDGHRFGDSGGPSRFFYTGKASRREKDKGCEHLFWKRADGEMVLISEEEWAELPKKERAKGNIHPSVKPLDLLRYLAKLFKPPDIVKSRLLVPFSGTGSEMIAAMQAGWGEVTGLEIDPNYVTIAEARITGTIGMF